MKERKPLYDLEPRIEEALERNPDARGSNDILYLEVIEAFIDTDMSVRAVLKHSKELGLPSYESVTRVRRMVQSRRPDLVDERKKIKREEAISDYKEYALDNDR